MEYVATQRCPSCKSTNTTVLSTTLPRAHKYHDPGVEVRWSCSNCRLTFEPSNRHVMTPILMCAKCGVPTKHTFHRSGRGIFRSLAADVQPSNSPIDHEIYVCPCGEERIYGSSSLPAPFLSVVPGKYSPPPSSDDAVFASRTNVL